MAHLCTFLFREPYEMKVACMVREKILHFTTLGNPSVTKAPRVVTEGDTGGQSKTTYHLGYTVHLW